MGEPPPLKSVSSPQLRRRASFTPLSPHSGPRGPCTHCDARTGRQVQDGLTLWTAPHPGTSFPSWACETAGKPRGGAHWKLGREEGYRYTALRNRSRWLHLRQLFPAQTQRGTGETPTLPRAQVPRTVCQQRGPACKGWSLGVITARPSFRRAFDRRRRTTVPAPSPTASAKVAATGEGGAGPPAQSSRELNASALVLPVRGRKCGASLPLPPLSAAAPLGPRYPSRLLGSSFAWPPLERGDGGL